MVSSVFDVINQQTQNTGNWSADDTSKSLAALASAQQQEDTNRQQEFQDSVAAAAQGYTPVSQGGSNTANWTVGQLGDPRKAGWAAANLKRINTPEGSVTVNKIAAKAFKGFLTALAARGYDAKSIGGFNVRNKVDKGSASSQLSNHAFGMAIDIDPGSNPQVYGKKAPHSLPNWVGGLANKYGILWGGDWNSKKDYMHFEYGGSVNRALARAKAKPKPKPKPPPKPPHGAQMGGV